MADLREACARRFTPEEMELLDQAIAFAKDAHKDQKRESGEPYYTHPEAVAQMLGGGETARAHARAMIER